MAVRVLNKAIYELIAAGEVVSRPKFVVKELVENSLDAGSKMINVEVKNGGKSLIRVVDNGVGMSFADCKLACLRHATSKIFSESDLNSIKTLGFRGEALASICAVSKVEILTKLKGANLGTHLINFGGVEQICEQIDCNEGTNFKVEQLFYNVPARLKFLKTDLTESNLIQDILEKLAISHFNVAFSFKKNGKKIFQTLGNGSLSDAIYSIYGKDVLKTFISVENVFKNVSVGGFVSKPVFCKARGNLNLCFVNKRYVKSNVFKNAVEQAFKGFLMVGKLPSYVLFLKIPYTDVDINVHPAKTQVNFVNESEVFRAIYLAVKQAIDKINDVFNQNYSTALPIKFEQNYNNKLGDDLNFENYSKNKNSDSCLNKNFVECGMASEVRNYEANKESDVFFNDLNAEFMNNSEKVYLNFKNNDTDFDYDKVAHCGKNLKINDGLELKLIGEIFKTYILAEFKNKFIVVDKHAAHERIIYDNLKKNLNNFEKQQIIKPLKIAINSSVDCNLVAMNLQIFSYFGFDVELFGEHNLLLRSVPAFLSEKNCTEIFYEIVENLKLNKFDLTPDTIEKILHSMACKAAIKANDLNNNEELFEIIKQIYFNKENRTCPHGRPVILVFEKKQFDTKFKRI